MTLMDAKLDAIIEHLGAAAKLQLERQIAIRLTIAEEQFRDIKARSALALP